MRERILFQKCLYENQKYVTYERHNFHRNASNVIRVKHSMKQK